MLNIGTGEIILILIVALLVLGPQRLPEMARGIGKFLHGFRKQTEEVRGMVEREFYRMDREIEKYTSLEPGTPTAPKHEGARVAFGSEPTAGELPEGELPPTTDPEVTTLAAPEDDADAEHSHHHHHPGHHGDDGSGEGEHGGHHEHHHHHGHPSDDDAGLTDAEPIGVDDDKTQIGRVDLQGPPSPRPLAPAARPKHSSMVATPSAAPSSSERSGQDDSEPVTAPRSKTQPS